MKKKKKQNKFIRFILKVLWIGLISTVGAGAWFALYALLWVILANKNEILLTLLTSGLLLAVFIYSYFKLRKSKKSLFRWSGKSLVLIAPLMVLSGLSLALMSSQQGQFSSIGGVSGNQGYVEGRTFKEATLLELTNNQRRSTSVQELKLNVLLSSSAEMKCKDMVKNDYWDHNSKEGKEPWQFIEEAGYKYDYAGENIAYGFTSENSTVNGWMDSEGHRKNILDGNFSEVGYGVCFSDNFIGQGKQLVVVQHLGSPVVTNDATIKNTSNFPGANYDTEPYVTPDYSTEPYIAPVCTEITIPYEIEYIDDPSMYIGETSGTGFGWDGYKRTCTTSSSGYKPADYTTLPYNEKVYRGTLARPPGSGSSQPSTPIIRNGTVPSCVPDGYGGYQC